MWLATGRWFSPGPPVSTNKTEIWLKVAVNTIKQTNKHPADLLLRDFILRSMFVFLLMEKLEFNFCNTKTGDFKCTYHCWPYYFFLQLIGLVHMMLILTNMALRERVINVCILTIIAPTNPKLKTIGTNIDDPTIQHTMKVIFWKCFILFVFVIK